MLVPAPRDHRVGEHLHAVRRARQHVQLGGHAGLVESERVLDVFVAEAVGTTDDHQRRRQPREVGRACGGRVRGDVAAVEVAEIAAATRTRSPRDSRSGDRRAGSTTWSGGRRSSGTRAAGTRPAPRRGHARAARAPRPGRRPRSRPRCRCDRARSRARRRARRSSAARRSSRRADRGTPSPARGGTRPTRRRTGSARTGGRTWRRPCRRSRARSRHRGSSTRTAAGRRCPSGRCTRTTTCGSSLTTWSVRSTASESGTPANISPRARAHRRQHVGRELEAERGGRERGCDLVVEDDSVHGAERTTVVRRCTRGQKRCNVEASRAVILDSRTERPPRSER